MVIHTVLAIVTITETRGSFHPDTTYNIIRIRFVFHLEQIIEHAEFVARARACKKTA